MSFTLHIPAVPPSAYPNPNSQTYISGPTIDVVGRTTFSYDKGRGNRIFSYDEVWEVEPMEALMQLLKPGDQNDDPRLPQ